MPDSYGWSTQEVCAESVGHSKSLFAHAESVAVRIC